MLMKEIQKTAMLQEILNLKIPPPPILIFWQLHIQVIFAGDRFVQYKNLLVVLIYFILSWCLFANSLTFVVGTSASCQFHFSILLPASWLPWSTCSRLLRPDYKQNLPNNKTWHGGGGISMIKNNITDQKHCWKKLGQ